MTESGVAVPAEDALVFQGNVFINFRTSRQWVLIKLFALPPELDDEAILALLIGHVRYRDSYAYPEFKDAEIIHGPYWLNAITPETFVAVPANEVEPLLRTWADYTVRLTDNDRAAMEREVYPRVVNATSRYQLPDLLETAQHDWGPGRTDGFHEFVLIDRRADEVSLLVATDD